MNSEKLNTIQIENETLCQIEAKVDNEIQLDASVISKEFEFLNNDSNVTLSYKRFNFGQWIVNFVHDNRRIIMPPSTLFLFSNGTFIMRRDWQSNLFSYRRPSNKLFQNFQLKENALVLDNDKLSFHVACGSGTANFRGSFDSFYYPLINRISIQMQGYAFNCR